GAGHQPADALLGFRRVAGGGGRGREVWRDLHFLHAEQRPPGDELRHEAGVPRPAEHSDPSAVRSVDNPVPNRFQRWPYRLRMTANEAKKALRIVESVIADLTAAGDGDRAERLREVAVAMRGA